MPKPSQFRLPQEALVKLVVLTSLVALGALAIAGPAGILAWGDNSRQLEQRQQEIAELKAERDVLRNRVDLLDPENADPDLVGELLRKNLNVAHPDEIVVARP